MRSIFVVALFCTVFVTALAFYGGPWGSKGNEKGGASQEEDSGSSELKRRPHKKYRKSVGRHGDDEDSSSQEHEPGKKWLRASQENSGSGESFSRTRKGHSSGRRHRSGKDWDSEKRGPGKRRRGSRRGQSSSASQENSRSSERNNIHQKSSSERSRHSDRDCGSRHGKGPLKLLGKLSHRIKQKLHKCPKWEKWEESKCLWPGKGLPQLPESCHFKNFTNKLPHPVVEYYKSKGLEALRTIEKIYKERGLTAGCGHCSRKVACRQRKQKSKKNKGFCMPVEFAFVNDDCDKGDACQISLVNGGCPAPIHQENFVKYNFLIAKHRKRSQGPFQFNGHRFGFDFQKKFGDNFDHIYADDPEGSSDEDSSEKEIDTSAGSSKEVPEVESSNESSSSSKENSSNSTGSSEVLIIIEEQKERYSYEIPLWHCIKNQAGDKCLCCCGGHFPDAVSGKCITVKDGNRYPPLDFEFEK